jgi:signal transduction histidine kinase/CheY-like chemotaxis protein
VERFFSEHGRGEERVRADVRRMILDVLDRSVHASVARFIAEAEGERERCERDLEASNEEKDRFIAMLSHELRNPIAPILNSVWLLKQPDVSDDRRRRSYDVIERQARHQARLIEDLLDVNRLARGKIVLRREVFDFREAVRHAVETCGGTLAEKSLHLEVDVPDDPVPIAGDGTRLAQVVTNLLTNAVKFTPPSGTIWVTVSRDADEVVLVVRDNGIGLAPQMLPRIFDMFAQDDRSLDRTRGGLGVGLTIAKTIVDMHGGRIAAASEALGKGATFTVRLPAERAAGALDAARAGRSLPVVIVDDNADVRQTLADVLATAGFETIAARDAEEALRIAADHVPAAYVIDIGLPGVNGYELAERLRGLPTSTRPLLIALSGYGSVEDARRAREAGFDHHLTKPADIDELRRILARRA